VEAPTVVIGFVVQFESVTAVQFEFELELSWLKIEELEWSLTIWNPRSINLYFYYPFATHAEEEKFTQFKKNDNAKCVS